MRRKKLHFKNSTYVIFTFIIAVLFFIANAIISSAGNNTRKEIIRVTQENYALELKLHDLEDELAFIKTDEGIELYARAQGMSMPGETHYTVH